MARLFVQTRQDLPEGAILEIIIDPDGTSTMLAHADHMSDEMAEAISEALNHGREQYPRTWPTVQTEIGAASTRTALQATD